VSRGDTPQLHPFRIDQLGNELTGGSGEVRHAVLNLIGTRQVEALNQQVTEIISNPEESDEFRLQAMKARVGIQPQISGEEFDILVDYLSDNNPSPIRQSAARILHQATLSEQQLLRIAQKQLPQADPFLVPSLIEAFQGNRSENVGLALVEVLNSSPETLDNVTRQDLQSLMNTYPEAVQTAAAPL